MKRYWWQKNNKLARKTRRLQAVAIAKGWHVSHLRAAPLRFSTTEEK